MKKIIRATTVPLSLDIFCNGMLKELSRNFEVIALSSPGEALDNIAEREGVRTIAIPMERQISIVNDCRSLWKMWKVFRGEKPTMVHSMTPKAGLICMVAAWMARVPVRVHTFTGLVWPTETGFKRKVLIFTDKLTCACATHVIPEGEGVKKDLVAGRITKKPLKVLGYGNVRGVDMEYYSRREEVMRKVEELGLQNNNKFTFLFVGRIVKDKGINELIEAFVRLYHDNPFIRLVLVGPCEDNLDPISQESRQIIDTYDDITPVGMKTGVDLLAYYAASDCFVMPSYREGFPNTVLEAGAMELPSIVTDINGSREIITNGVNGMIVPPRDADGLYAAMSAVLKSKIDRENMAAQARKIIADRFEQSFVRHCLYKYYDEILKS